MQGLSAPRGLDAPSAALKTLSNIIQQQALLMAFSDVFLILAGVLRCHDADRTRQEPPAGGRCRRRALAFHPDMRLPAATCLQGCPSF